jgi:hypothetical protein
MPFDIQNHFLQPTAGEPAGPSLMFCLLSGIMTAP